jgi:hypothetical protein
MGYIYIIICLWKIYKIPAVHRLFLQVLAEQISARAEMSEIALAAAEAASVAQVASSGGPWLNGNPWKTQGKW